LSDSETHLAAPDERDSGGRNRGIRVGGVSANMVEAIILEDAQPPVALLGMSFLKQAKLEQEDGRQTLSQRY